MRFSSLAVLLLAATASVDGLMSPLHACCQSTVTRGMEARLMARLDDPILDESLPDPVFDDNTPYLGRASFGFNSFAEAINGRAAMIGFVILFLQELVVGKGVLEQYGLPYDAGALLK